MVDFIPDQVSAAVALPRFCPKCGSHRTEIIGRSKHGNTVTLRCNTCGAHSEVTQDDQHLRGDPFSAELDAILAISQALSRLRADERQRVLNWAAECFSAKATTDSIGRKTEPADHTLRVDDLDELFVSPGSIRGTVQLDAGHELADLFDEAAVGQRVHVDESLGEQANRGQGLPLESQRFEPPLDVVLADFVSDFRRLATEWERA